MNQDITLGITLKADGSDLVGEVRVSERELKKLGDTARATGANAAKGAKGVDQFGDESKKTAAEARRLNTETKQLGQQFDRVQQRATLLKAAVIGLATGMAARLAKSFVDAASTSERYATTLKVVLGDVREANRLFDDMSKFAAKVPFEFEQIMGAATQLAGVVRGGREEIGQLIPIIGDIAAATGLSIEETTSQIIRMYSAGAASADLFRERGVLAGLGFQAGVSYSAEETMRHVIESWENGTAKFKGATDELIKTWAGAVSNMWDKWFWFRNQVMDAAPFDYLKATIQLLNEEFDQNIEGMKGTAEDLGHGVVDVVKDVVLGAADIYDAVNPAFDGVSGAAQILWSGFKSLPDWVRDAGLVGALLFGRVGWGVVAGASAVNELANEINAATQKAMQEAGFPKGLRDFMNSPTGYMFGEDSAPEDLPDIDFGGQKKKSTSARESAERAIAAIETRVAKLRAEQDAAEQGRSGGAGSAGRGTTPGNGAPGKDAGGDKIAALELELDKLNQIRQAIDAAGQADRFLIEVIEAETEARKAGLEVGSAAYHRYVELALAIKDQKTAIDESEAAEKKHAETVKDIEREYGRLPKTYEQAIAAARKWRQEALAGLDQTKTGYGQFAAEVEAVYQHQLKEAYDEHLASSRRWEDGIVRGFRKVADEAGDMASHIETTITSAASAVEDAFVEMYRTGEFNFSSLADAVIEDLIRMQVRASITAPLSGFLSNAFSDLFSFGGTDLIGDFPTGGTTAVAHGGGMMGGPNAFGSRTVDPSLFIDAPRYHGGTGGVGLGPGERTAIVKQGEIIGWPNQLRHAFGGGETQVNIYDQRGAGAPDIEVRRQRGLDGMDMVDVVVPAFEQAADAGRLDKSLGDNWGGNRRPLPGA